MKNSLLILLSVFLCSCAHMQRNNYELKINSLSIDDKPTEFTVVSDMESLSTEDIRFKHFSNILSSALKSAGYKEGTNGIVVRLSFDVLTYSTLPSSLTSPIYGYYENGKKYTGIGHEPAFDKSNYISYSRIITIRAFRNGTNIWTTEIASRGESNNLKKVFPYIMNGAIPYLGKDLKETVSGIVPESNERLEYLNQ